MLVSRAIRETGTVDLLDRILDKGIVVDIWARVGIVGVDLITLESRIVVASIDTYLKYAGPIALLGQVSRPKLLSGDRVKV